MKRGFYKLIVLAAIFFLLAWSLPGSFLKTPNTAEAQGTVILTENFDNLAALNAWTVVNQGTEQGPSNWRVANQELAQTSNIYSNTPGVAGTHIYYTGGFGWTDYSASTTLRSTDNDVLGLMFRYQDQNNHYRFIMSSENGFRRLERVAGGVVTVLATDNVAYTPNKKYYLTVSAIGSVLQASVNGTPVFTVTDSTFPSGTIAAFSSYNAGSYFDNLTVTDRSGEPAPDPIVDPAPDPVAGNLIANPSLESQAGLNQPYSWSSSFWGTNNALFTYPVAGYSSPRAATVQITDYTDGEARWYFDDVPVTGGGNTCSPIITDRTFRPPSPSATKRPAAPIASFIPAPPTCRRRPTGKNTSR